MYARLSWKLIDPPLVKDAKTDDPLPLCPRQTPYTYGQSLKYIDILNIAGFYNYLSLEICTFTFAFSVARVAW